MTRSDLTDNVTLYRVRNEAKYMGGVVEEKYDEATEEFVRDGVVTPKLEIVSSEGLGEDLHVTQVGTDFPGRLAQVSRRRLGRVAQGGRGEPSRSRAAREGHPTVPRQR